MTEMFQKRGREHEALSDSIDVRELPRLNTEKTDPFFRLLQFDKSLANNEDDCASSAEFVNGVMRNLKEEIGVTSYHSSTFGGNSTGSDIFNGHVGETRASDSVIDLRYLLEASDDELGIPPNPVLNWIDEVCQSPEETSEGISPDLKSLGETWHFEDDFHNHQQFAVYEDAWDANQDYIHGDFVNQGMLFDADFSAASKLETENSR